MATTDITQPLKIAQSDQDVTALSELAITRVVKDATPSKVDKTAKRYIQRVSDGSNLSSQSYLQYSQQLYDWMIRPLQAELEKQEIDTLIFVLDDGLRTLPVAALHDGEKFWSRIIIWR
ncbi:MAG: CHAT domain-containing protein [Acaryochloridaceae cyanobacterium RL_2_7]|nr:CHAT domain-containing protein [Acaryochloridaceae cyanobacterium RL_2_7]